MLDKIFSYINENPKDFEAYNDYFQYLRSDLEELDYDRLVEFRKFISTNINVYREDDPSLSIDLYNLLGKTYLLTAKMKFEDYMIYLEWDREPKDKFYMPRKRVLKPVVEALQKIADGELNELFLSMPPRVGKTTLILFFATWIIGRDSERSNLYSAYSDIITTAFYNGVLEILKDDVTYKWHDIFNEQIANTNAKEEILNIGRKKRYPSLTARSLYGTLNGACDCNGVLISDDLIGGIEEALNPDRLHAAWTKVDNNLVPRAKESVTDKDGNLRSSAIVWIGTRWSKYDPIGLRLDVLENDEKFKNRRWATVFLPALNENDESNFEYDYGVGFSTEYYHQRRASFEKQDDMASWFAQYQNQPVERSGLLFDPSNMNYFNGELPPEGLVRKFMACDPAFGGGDFVAAPICYEYDDGRCFIVDVVYSNENKVITQPLIANKIMKWNIKSAQFECNQSTLAYKEKVEELLKEKQYRLNIFHRAAPNNVAKETRIYENAPEIRELYFLENGKRDKMYESFMQNVFAFTMNGKNKHDDAPDSLAMLVQMKFSSGKNVTIARRSF